jgi:hypothetical protein
MSLPGSSDVHLMPVDPDFTSIPRAGATQYLHQSGFTGAILPKQRMNLSAEKVKIHSVQCHRTREGFSDTPHLKDGIGRTLRHE